MADTVAAAPPTNAPAQTTAATPAAPPEAPKTNAEIETLRREALAANKSLRERDAALTQMRAELERSKAADAELEALKSKDLHAYLERKLGMSRADLTRSLMSVGKKPDPIDETKRAVEELRAAMAERDSRAEEDRKRQEAAHDETITTRAFQMLRHEIVSDPEGQFELLKEQMDENPKAWARVVREYADKHPQKTAREVATDLHEAALARIEKLIQNPRIRRSLKIDQPPQPAATPGPLTPKTLTSKLSSEKSAAPPKVSAAESKKLREMAALRAWEEAEARSKNAG